MRIFNRTRGNWLVVEGKEARTFWRRLQGWFGSPAPKPGQGLYFSPCQWVHTLGFGQALDVVYVDRQGKILALHTLPPWRVGPWIFKAAGVLELSAGYGAKAGCEIGDQLEMEGAGPW